jgi:outer membrane lipoprotein SlyB
MSYESLMGMSLGTNGEAALTAQEVAAATAFPGLATPPARTLDQTTRMALNLLGGAFKGAIVGALVGVATDSSGVRLKRGAKNGAIAGAIVGAPTQLLLGGQGFVNLQMLVPAAAASAYTFKNRYGRWPSKPQNLIGRP